jgi:hypothetical protein
MLEIQTIECDEEKDIDQRKQTPAHELEKMVT